MTDVDPQAWVGRTATRVDALTGRSVAGLQALMDGPPVAEAPPLLAHWLVGPDIVPQSRLAEDGHPVRGELLPPLTLPRRMWAASAVRWHAPMPTDVPLTRRSTVRSVTPKSGRTGALVFVEVAHLWSDAGGTVLLDDVQHIVYRGATPAAAPPGQPGDAAALDWPLRRDLVPSTSLLFRYSALTFNAHRIHYDAAYARDVEGYPALVVHGPLMATLLADLACRSAGGGRVTAFSFRSRAPAFVDRPLHLRGRRLGDVVELQALDGDGQVLIGAEARLADGSVP